jgi:hypothetical protein
MFSSDKFIKKKKKIENEENQRKAKNHETDVLERLPSTPSALINSVKS